MKYALKKITADKKKVMAFIMLITLAIAFSIMAIRFFSHHPSEIGGQPFLHERIAERLAKGSFTSQDDLVWGGRKNILTPYHIVLGILIAMHLPLPSIVAPFLFTVMSMIFFYLLIRRLFPFETIAMIFMLLITSPPFIYLMIVSTPQSLAIAATFSGMYFFLDGNRKKAGIGIALLALASSFSLFNVIIVLAFAIFCAKFFPELRKRTIILILLSGMVYAIHPTPFYPTIKFSSVNILQESISDLGGMNGMSIFFSILSILGFLVSWKNKNKYYPLYGIILFFALSFFAVGSEVFIYAIFPLTVLAAIGGIQLTQLLWKIDIVRNLTYLMIICGILFSMISYSARLVQSEPNDEIVESLLWLKNNSREERVVLSDYRAGYWIEEIAGRKVVLDSSFDTIPSFNEKFLDIYSLLHAVELKEADSIMYEKYGIDYVWITESMKQGVVWEKPGEGLLFLLRNNETFKNIYKSENVEIWKVIRRS